MNKTTLAFLFIFLFTSSFQQPITGIKGKNVPILIDKSVKVRINATLKSFVDSGQIAGVSALIFEKNKEAYYNAFGYADREAKSRWSGILLCASIP